ncbi:MAG TPA: GspE/PulE family protein [Actinomycetota bacterium]|nr:GspE/PulE family protein [Actinomycetota bacterium]
MALVMPPSANNPASPDDNAFSSVETAPRSNPRELAARHGLEFVDLAREQVEPAAADAIPLALLERLGAVPYRLAGDHLSVAIPDPADLGVIDQLRLSTRFTVDVAVASRQEIQNALKRIGRGRQFTARASAMDVVSLEVDGPPDVEADETFDLEAAERGGDAPPIQLVNSIILQAAEDGASDIHFLPRSDGIAVRVRIDGVVHEVDRIPRRHAAAVVSRLKVLAKLDIAEHRRPQDGRISLRATRSGQLLDARLAVLPTVDGEGVVMRLLDKSRRAPTLTEIGLSNTMQMAVEQAIHRTSGSLLCTGPTGSGKSTTVYAALADIIRPEISVITIEDPVEYRLHDIYQMQVDPRWGLSFATALRSILRGDPDVIMVGEIRDLETAKIAVEAAMTGHFVLSTLHASDAPGALTRLAEMGVEPYFTSAAISGVVSQRLIRRLCLECREPYEPRAEEVASLYLPPEFDGELTLYRKRGCGSCFKGYSGRIGVYQYMDVGNEIKELVSRGATSAELEQAAVDGGMRSLWADGSEKVAGGLTTAEELHRMLR